jgi:hypothetical protein
MQVVTHEDLVAADTDGDGRVDEVCHSVCAAVVSLHSGAFL